MIVWQLAKLKRIQNKQPKLMYLKGNLVASYRFTRGGYRFQSGIFIIKQHSGRFHSESI